MAYTYTTRNGHRVEINVAIAFDKMAAAFKRDTGCTLYISSGTRTRQEQIDIFLNRYVTASQVRGRKVYDTRMWNGTRYYRISSVGTVAVPGTSNHEEYGPNGPRSLDLYDSGADYGVSRFGTARNAWMAVNAGKYGFENEGYNFNEAWHKTYRGPIGGPGPATAGSAGGETISVPKEGENMQSINVNGRQYGIDVEFLTHYGDLAQANVTRQVSSATDELHTISTQQFASLLDGYGIPRYAVNAAGDVLNPESGKYEYNGTYSRRREIRADIAALRKSLSK